MAAGCDGQRQRERGSCLEKSPAQEEEEEEEGRRGKDKCFSSFCSGSKTSHVAVSGGCLHPGVTLLMGSVDSA